MKNINPVAILVFWSFLSSVPCMPTSQEVPDMRPTAMMEVSSSTSCKESFSSCRDSIINPRCFSSNRSAIWKRTTRADGPFWANRGKKDPFLSTTRFYAEEPRWELVRRDEPTAGYDPYFTTRGKKQRADAGSSLNRRIRDKLYDVASPFLAARGKKHQAAQVVD